MFIHNCTARLLSNQTLHRTGIVKAGSRQIILSYFVCNAKEKKSTSCPWQGGWFFIWQYLLWSFKTNKTNVQIGNDKIDGLYLKFITIKILDKSNFVRNLDCSLNMTYWCLRPESSEIERLLSYASIILAEFHRQIGTWYYRSF